MHRSIDHGHLQDHHPRPGQQESERPRSDQLSGFRQVFTHRVGGSVKHIWFRSLFASMLLFVLVACQSPDDPRDPGINAYVAALPAWETPQVQNVDSRELEEGDLIFDDVLHTCTVETRTLDPEQTTYTDIFLAGLDEDVLYPGSLLQGDDIEQGLLRSVRLPRSPITMTISLNTEETSITVANPTTSAMRTAVANLIRRADTRLGGDTIDVVPGNMFFNRTEAHSYEQSLNAVGISAGYDDKIFTSVNASFNFGSERTADSHTITVNLVEPLFTIFFEEDNLRTPADLFAETVTAEDLRQEESAGRMGRDNLPVYVKSVTYGRVMMYTLTSTEVETFEELETAVRASHGAFGAELDGSVEYGEQERNIIRNSRETLIAFGGSQEASKAAILDLDNFFVPIEATQAVPISYEIRDLKGNVASVGDITEYKVQTCRRAPDVSESFEISLDRLDVHATHCRGFDFFFPVYHDQLYGDLDINREEVWVLPVAGYKEGGEFPVGRQRTVEIPADSGDTIEVRGRVVVRDEGESDLVIRPSINHPPVTFDFEIDPVTLGLEENATGRYTKTVSSYQVGGNCRATLRYSVTYLGPSQ